MGCVKENVPQFATMNDDSPPAAVLPSKDAKRRVSFCDDVEVMETITPSSHLTEEEQNEIWYSTVELNEFKDNAKNLCQRLFLLDPDNIINPDTTRFTSCCSKKHDKHDNENECIRGMERYISSNRCKHKCLVVRVILKAHERSCSPERLALIAQKCSWPAQHVAQMAAVRDFCMAHDIPIVEDQAFLVENNNSNHPLNVKPTKRKAPSENKPNETCSQTVKKRRLESSSPTGETNLVTTP